MWEGKALGRGKLNMGQDGRKLRRYSMESEERGGNGREIYGLKSCDHVTPAFLELHNGIN